MIVSASCSFLSSSLTPYLSSCLLFYIVSLPVCMKVRPEAHICRPMMHCSWGHHIGQCCYKLSPETFNGSTKMSFLFVDCWCQVEINCDQRELVLTPANFPRNGLWGQEMDLDVTSKTWENHCQNKFTFISDTPFQVGFRLEMKLFSKQLG